MLVLGLVAGVVLGAAAAFAWQARQRRRALAVRHRASRIAFPFTAAGLSQTALAAALRVARAEQATLMPAYLAIVPRRLSLDCEMPSEAEIAFPLLEAIEQRAMRAGVPVDARVERGRSVRHALERLAEHERYQRIIVAASAEEGGDGFSPDDVAWLMSHSAAEVLALRPATAGAAPAEASDPPDPSAAAAA